MGIVYSLRNHCFVSFIDEHTSELYILGEKYKASEVFKTIHQIVLTQFHTKNSKTRAQSGQRECPLVKLFPESNLEKMMILQSSKTWQNLGKIV